MKKDLLVYVFSSLPDDESLDSIKPKGVVLDESLIDDPIDIKKFADTVVKFDDVHVLTNKKIKEEVCKLMNQGLDIGRHYRINMVITNHLPSNRKETRRVLNESSSFTYFPHSATAKIRYVLENDVGIDKNRITYLQHQSCNNFQELPNELLK